MTTTSQAAAGITYRIEHGSAAQQQGEPSVVVVNPFASEGALSRKADYILAHSTITRSQLHIADSDVIADCDVTSADAAIAHRGDVSANGRAPLADGTAAAAERNGGMVVAEVQRTTVAPARELKAEHVTIANEKRRGICCTCCVA